MKSELFQKKSLDEENFIYTGFLSKALQEQLAKFETYWKLHPKDFHQVEMFGKMVDTPRWQQAYGANYRYTGSRNNALPYPSEFSPFRDWVQKEIDPKLNGLLVNWYDAQQKHYIGAHRDDSRDLVEGKPIVSIALGEARIFRMRPYKQKGKVDIAMPHASIIIIPWETNKKWTHEVPHFSRYRKKRISLTFRAFQ
jgi:alkylated DNA repair dioxygenase AlkB